MSNYESTFIFSPEVPQEKVEDLISKLKKMVENASGQVLLSQNLGRKKLAYPIKKHREGVYFYMEFSQNGTVVSDIEKFCKVNDAVIRYLTVKKVKKTPPPAKAPAEKQAPKEVKEDGQQHESEAAGTK